MRNTIITATVLASVALLAGDPDPLDEVCDVIADYAPDGTQTLRNGDMTEVPPVDMTGDGRVVFCAVLP